MNKPVDQNLDLNSPASDNPKRDAERDSLFLKTKIQFANGETYDDVRVRNISAGGMMAEAAIQPKRGDSLEVELRNIGWVTGSVAWVATGRFGIAFDHSIDPKLARKPVGNGMAKTVMPEYLKQHHRTFLSKFR